MKYYRYMWIGESLADKKRSIQRRLRLNILPQSVYVLALPTGNTHLLDIYPSAVLKNRYYKTCNQLIIGLAGSKDEAMELGGQILSSIYRETDGFDLKDYIKKTLKAGA